MQCESLLTVGYGLYGYSESKPRMLDTWKLESVDPYCHCVIADGIRFVFFLPNTQTLHHILNLLLYLCVCVCMSL